MKLYFELTAAEMDKSYEIINKINVLCGSKVLDMAEIAKTQKNYKRTTEAASVVGTRDDNGNISMDMWIDDQLIVESLDVYSDAIVGIINICMTTIKSFKGLMSELKESCNTLNKRWENKLLTKKEKKNRRKAERREIDRKVEEIYGIDLRNVRRAKRRQQRRDKQTNYNIPNSHE